jgi:MOSC domain-containing protein YiiM
MPVLKSIAYRPKNQPEPTIGYLRVSLAEANLVANYGIENDAKGGNPNRNLNVMDEITLAELTAEGYPSGIGTMGENLIISGLDLRTVQAGKHMQIGAEAVIELTKPRTGCHQLHAMDGRMPDSVEGRIGYICRVLKAGVIRVGDSVEIVGEPVASTQA